MHTEVHHPLVQHKLSILRDASTGTKQFRELASEITLFLTYEALKNLDTAPCDVETPLMTAHCRRLENELVVMPILRAGIGMMDGVATMVPNVRVGFIGLYRDPKTALPIEYYAKLPDAKPGSIAIVVDPMLATGGSASAAITLIKKRGFRKIIFVCMVSCPEGITRLEADHPDVPIFTAAIDERLNEHKYILPGLGDAGDRLFGTK